MNDESNHLPNAEELRDRLVDRGLRELLGGETPRDLSERILAAAGGQGAMATQVVGGEAMDGREIKGGWAQFAVAATLLIGVGAAIWAYQVRAPQMARRAETQSVALNAPDDSGSVSRSGGEVISSNSGDDDGSPVPRLRELEHEIEIQAPAAIATASTSGEQQSAAGQANREEASGPQLPAPQEPMGLQGQYAGDRAGKGQAASRPGLVAQGESRAAQPNYTADLDVPFRQGSFDLTVPSLGKPERSLGKPEPSPLSIEEAAAGRESKTVGLEQRRMPHQLYYGVARSQAGDDDARTLQKLRGSNAAAPHAGNRVAVAEQEPLLRAYDDSHRRVWAWNDDAAGRGPESGGDKYTQIVENAFKAVSTANTDNRLSTFSIDVDTASYANVRQFLMQSHALPPADAVRIEELVNYFDYGYSAPTGNVPFDANVEVAACPWAPEHRLARIGIKGREMERSKRPQSNLVFLIDVSGSMDEPNKLPLLVEGMKLLTRELGENDRVAIVVYASSEGLALESTPGTEQSTILRALDQLAAGGSTAGGAGIQLAYQVAADHFIKGGTNRVILCTDGDFNVGVTSPAELERMAEAKAKETGVFLTVLGFGRGNLNDAMMEQIADKGNGNYHYVDTRKEARKVLVEEMAGTLVTIAKDVKIQVEFNPAKVAGYRLIGYENRVLAAEDFNDDKKDAGEIGAGHTVTALYEIVPAGKPVAAAKVDELKYGGGAKPQANGESDTDDESAYGEGEASDELLTLKIRYKAPDGDKSKKLEFPIADNGQSFAKASEDFKFASSVASFGMLLRGSEFKGNATYAAVAEIAKAASDRDPQGYRAEFVEMVGRAMELSGE
jgi:Ca-activated chloride channel family protein